MELPTINTNALTNTVYVSDSTTTAGADFMVQPSRTVPEHFHKQMERLIPSVQASWQTFIPNNLRVEVDDIPDEDDNMAQTGMRVVQIYIIDPEKELKLEQRLLHQSDEFLTDLTDQELFFELDIKNLLDVHNNLRGGVKDKEASTKDETVFLEPIRVRDLIMTVCVKAEF